MSCRVPGCITSLAQSNLTSRLTRTFSRELEEDNCALAHSFPPLPTYKPGTYRAVTPARFGKVSHGSLVSLLFLRDFYVLDVKFHSQCKMAEVYFIAHAVGNPGVFEISISFEKNIKMTKIYFCHVLKKYFTKISKYFTKIS